MLDRLTDGLIFTLNGIKYLPNKNVYIEDFPNDHGAALVCHTHNVNTECCRSSDNNGKGPIGDWFYPDNSTVIHNNQDTTDNTFVQIRFDREVRLVKRGSPTGPLGLYRCDIPNSKGEIVSSSIFIRSKGKLQLLESSHCTLSQK